MPATVKALVVKAHVAQPKTAPEAPMTTGLLETVIGPPPDKVVVAIVPKEAGFVMSPRPVQ